MSAIQEYREAVLKVAREGHTELLSEHRGKLNTVIGRLGLSAREAALLEDEIFLPLRKYERKFIQLLVEESSPDKLKVNQLREELMLKKQNIENLEKRLITEKITYEKTFGKYIGLGGGAVATSLGVLAVATGGISLAPIALAGLMLAVSGVSLITGEEYVKKRRMVWIDALKDTDLSTLNPALNKALKLDEESQAKE